MFQVTSGFAQTPEEKTKELGMSAFGSKGTRQGKMPKISERASAASKDYQGVKQVDLFSGADGSSGLPAHTNHRSETGIHNSL